MMMLESATRSLIWVHLLGLIDHSCIPAAGDFVAMRVAFSYSIDAKKR